MFCSQPEKFYSAEDRGQFLEMFSLGEARKAA